MQTMLQQGAALLLESSSLLLSRHCLVVPGRGVWLELQSTLEAGQQICFFLSLLPSETVRRVPGAYFM